MKYLILGLLLLCYSASYSEGYTFTRDKCNECCNAFTEPSENQYCNEKCEEKFSSPQNFNSERACKKACDILPGIICASYCHEGCEKDFAEKQKKWWFF